MTKIEHIQKLNSDVIRKLRINKLAAGKPFMINDKNLPSNQSYLEFPDHSIKLVGISVNQRDFTVISVLSKEEAIQIRKNYHLI
jgi:hypothetical protein